MLLKDIFLSHQYLSRTRLEKMITRSINTMDIYVSSRNVCKWHHGNTGEVGCPYDWSLRRTKPLITGETSFC